MGLSWSTCDGALADWIDLVVDRLVLNLCRALWVWSAHSSRLTPSKEEAGGWAIRVLPESQTDLVVAALEGYRSSAPVRPEDRKTAGREWDRVGLLRFRDYLRQVSEQSRRGARFVPSGDRRFADG